MVTFAGLKIIRRLLESPYTDIYKNHAKIVQTFLLIKHMI